MSYDVIVKCSVLDLILWQFDIKGAYLHADMDMPVYMRQFQGHERYGPNGEKLVCKLVRALYGSKQAGRLWRKKLATWLIKFGFMQCAYDECCYDGSNSLSKRFRSNSRNQSSNRCLI